MTENNDNAGTEQTVAPPTGAARPASAAQPTESGNQQNVALSEAGIKAIRKSMRNRGCLIALAVVVLPVLAFHSFIGGWPVHYGAPVRGRVIDEHTGMPVAGAVVVGEWCAAAFMGAEHRMHASEAITNARGEFFLPGMPLKVRLLWDYYRSDEPRLSIYKPGYAITTADNRILEGPGNRPYSMAMKRVSHWDGKDLPLLPVDDVESEAEWLRRIEDLAMAGHDPLIPRRFPHLWSTILHGARRIPKGQFKDGDPRKTYQYFMRNDE